MIKLWQLLLRADLPSGPLDETRFTVFGLGDSAYERFCWASKKVIWWMESLGAREFYPGCTQMSENNSGRCRLFWIYFVLVRLTGSVDTMASSGRG